MKWKKLRAGMYYHKHFLLVRVECGCGNVLWEVSADCGNGIIRELRKKDAIREFEENWHWIKEKHKELPENKKAVRIDDWR